MPAPAAVRRTAATLTRRRARHARAFESRVWVGLAVAGLLVAPLRPGRPSLLEENPTIDEVVHLPAGVTYWQKQTFRLYHHNPPLVKLVAALPVVWSGVGDRRHSMNRSAGTSASPDQATFGHLFAALNAERLFRAVSARTADDASLFGARWPGRLCVVAAGCTATGEGFLSLSLWVFCPNVLAHGRLITTDMGSTALGVAATFVFWLYLQKPSWRRAVAAGVLLGLAELTKFSMLLLYASLAVPVARAFVLVWPRTEWLARARRGLAHGAAIVAISFLTIDAGYLFEGVGIPLGRFEFGSRTLTTWVTARDEAPAQPKPALRHRLAVSRQPIPRDLARRHSLPAAGALRARVRRTEDRDRGHAAQWSEPDLARQSARSKPSPAPLTSRQTPTTLPESERAGDAGRSHRRLPCLLERRHPPNRLVVLLSAHASLQGPGGDVALDRAVSCGRRGDHSIAPAVARRSPCGLFRSSSCSR